MKYRIGIRNKSITTWFSDGNVDTYYTLSKQSTLFEVRIHGTKSPHHVACLLSGRSVGRHRLLLLLHWLVTTVTFSPLLLRTENMSAVEVGGNAVWSFLSNDKLVNLERVEGVESVVYKFASHRANIITIHNRVIMFDEG